MHGRASVGRLVTVAAAASLVVAVCAGIAGDRLPLVPGGEEEQAKAAEAKAQQAYGRLPMSFVPNAGQSAPEVAFQARGEGYNLFLTPSEAVVSLAKPGAGPTAAGGGSDVLRMQLRGSNPSATPVQGQPLPGKVNYLIGDRSQWRTNLATYGDVAFQGVYPGIDVKYRGSQGAFEYDFVVAPGADPGAIRLGMEGSDSLSIGPEGDLVIATPGGELRHRKPVIFQDVGGQRQLVAGNFVLLGDRDVGFEVASYDTSATLVIDPLATLAFSTYFGGTANDFGFGIAVDSRGNAYLGGQTGSAVFPRGSGGDPLPIGATTGAFQTVMAGSTDGYVLKVNPAGNALLYATYIGGSRTDAGWDLEIDSAGNAYLAGTTNSADDPGTTAVEKGFPTTDGTGGTVAAFDSTCGTDGFCNNVLPDNFFVDACDPLDPTCTGMGDPGFLPAICPPATFPAGCATPPGQPDSFLSKLSPGGDKLLYSTLYGGAAAEGSPDEVPYAGQMGIAVDGTSAYLTATTFSDDFPTTAKAFQPACASCGDGVNDSYLSVFQTTVGGAPGLTYSTFVGGTGFDEGKAVAVDSQGSAYLTGVITGVDPTPGSTTFPVKLPLGGTYLGSGAYSGSSYRGGYSDAYLTKIKPSNATASATLVFSSFLGGGGTEEGWSVAVGRKRPGRHIAVTGYTTSGANPNPQVEDPAHPGACVAAPDPDTGVRPFCDFASDPAPYFPITAGASQTVFAGRATTDSGSTLFFDGDAFVALVDGNGTSLLHSTYLGGVNADYGQSIALDSAGNAYVAGWTTCRTQDPPGPVGPPPQFEADGSPTGRNPGEPAATGVADCPAGFPTVNAPAYVPPAVVDPVDLAVMNSFNLGFENHNSPTDMFVSKLPLAGGPVTYSVLLNGKGFDRGFSIAVREPAKGGTPEAYVTGRTGSASGGAAFPITTGSYDTTFNGSGRDAIIAKIVG